MRLLAVLLERKARCGFNSLRELTPWEWARNAAFAAAGFFMLMGLHHGFLRLLRFLDGVPLIGPLLIWKLTAVALLSTFSMVALSSVLISLTTLFYSFDLPFLMKAPLPEPVVFAEKSLESAFFSSWMLLLVLLPFLFALGEVRGLPWTFYAAFGWLWIPFALLAASIGMGFTLALMRLFPSSRTRDALWLLSSLSLAGVYVLLRLSEPERLARPDILQRVADYLRYLQAPTAPALPSWWLALALQSFDGVRPSGAAIFWGQSALLTGSAATVYAGLLWIAGKTYGEAYSGAQESARSGRSQEVLPTPESRLAARLSSWGLIDGQQALRFAASFWKDRRTFFRDVRHWSQMALVLALMAVYLFSVRNLPLDTPDLKNLVAFLNIAVAGFVISSLGLRFTFPAISMEGRAFWVTRCSPQGLGALMAGKFLFHWIPMVLLSMTLIVVSNRLLRADPFISWLSAGTVFVMTATLCGMGVGFGALFPRFNTTNIHQIESSAGGFVYMAAAIGYIALTIALEVLPVQMHFQQRFGISRGWDAAALGLCALGLLLLNAAAFLGPWLLGRRHLEHYEEK